MHRREGGAERGGRQKKAEEIRSRVGSHSGGGRKSREPAAARGGGEEALPLLFNFADPALHGIGPCRGGELQLLSMLDGEGGGRGGGARLQAIKGLGGSDQHPGPPVPPTSRGPGSSRRLHPVLTWPHGWSPGSIAASPGASFIRSGVPRPTRDASTNSPGPIFGSSVLGPFWRQARPVLVEAP
ncbi:hypothetical protein NDU88_004648 [Pleurodeles waltl]|uniref:Uncharacterized protein n=1 Tax=Pleurodeles waltl TaxID=8319 RepID=A0AAV7LRL2_PLEWA|nr:hypothetical protein NDU88_004648 [Pleurodeles waltl]